MDPLEFDTVFRRRVCYLGCQKPCTPPWGKVELRWTGWVDHLQACQQGGDQPEPVGKTSQKGCDVHQVQLLNRLPGLVSASGDPWTHWSSTPSFAGECATWAAKNRAHHPGGKLSCTGRGGLITSKLADLITKLSTSNQGVVQQVKKGCDVHQVQPLN